MRGHPGLFFLRDLINDDKAGEAPRKALTQAHERNCAVPAYRTLGDLTPDNI